MPLHIPFALGQGILRSRVRAGTLRVRHACDLGLQHRATSMSEGTLVLDGGERYGTNEIEIVLCLIGSLMFLAYHCFGLGIEFV